MRKYRSLEYLYRTQEELLDRVKKLGKGQVIKLSFEEKERIRKIEKRNELIRLGKNIQSIRRYITLIRVLRGEPDLWEGVIMDQLSGMEKTIESVELIVRRLIAQFDHQNREIKE